MRVLLVEDEQPLATYIAAGLRKHGCAVDVTHDGQQAMDKSELVPYDVVVLDRDLPVLHGDTVCRRLAQRGAARILMLTASGAVADRVDGLALGADDYLGKPFAFAELVARVRALGRRSTPASPPILRAGGVELDPARRAGRAGGPVAGPDPQGVRGAGTAARRGRCRGERRDAAGQGVGRARGPVHQRRPDHHGHAAPQARRPAADRDRDRRRVPHRRMSRLTARGGLTLVYTGLVLVAGLLWLGLTYLLLRNNLRLSYPVPDAGVGTRLRAQAIADLLLQAGLALLVVTALTGLIGWLLAGRILRPVRAIADAANRLSAENLSERVPVRGPADELTTLAGTINGMLDRIQHGVADRDRVLDSQRLFVANAAHELRTPLTTMRTAIDVTLDGEPGRAELLAMAADIATAVETSRRTLDGLLLLARSQAGQLRRTPLDLARVGTAAVADAAGRAAAGTVTLRTDLRAAPAGGEPVLLERLAGNLLENAVRYNHAGGSVEVSSGTAGGRAFLRVVNTGPPITAAEHQRLFEPFVRGAAGGTRGAGLGLSIVRAVVTAHDGEIASSARAGGGLDITVRLPLAG
ncbi:histidine kinase [Actinoplanes sp. N902-109]|nr:histidine kinase [Actinoplanes sp. N902-109]